MSVLIGLIPDSNMVTLVFSVERSVAMLEVSVHTLLFSEAIGTFPSTMSDIAVSKASVFLGFKCFEMLISTFLIFSVTFM